MAQNQNDLTTLANVKQWLAGVGGGSNAQDVLISQLITRMSAVALAWMSRDSLLSRTYTENKNGRGGHFIVLKQFPVTSISSLIINNTNVVPGPPNTVGAQVSNALPGYYLENWDGLPPGKPAQVSVVGIAFTRSIGNVTVVYRAGYLYQGDTQVIPGTPYKVTPASPYGLMVLDAGVTFANGTPLTAIASGTPTTGQYLPPNPLDPVNPTTQYLFAAADTGKTVILSYSYVPVAIEGAICEWCAERFQYRGRIGEKSKSLGGQETISYDTSSIPPFVQTVLNQFRSVVPIV